jgi:hypothetical protein
MASLYPHLPVLSSQIIITFYKIPTDKQHTASTVLQRGHYVTLKVLKKYNNFFCAQVNFSRVSGENFHHD